MDLTEARGAPFRRHPWEVTRARFFRRLLRDTGVMHTPKTVIDVGAGDGYVATALLAALPAGSRMVCYDVHYTDRDLAAYADASIESLTFTRQRPTERFDVVLLLDVLEHVPDDHAFLKGIVDELLAPGGTVLVSVPAWQGLFGKHDEALKHYRRYNPAALRAMLSEAGLVIRNSGGAFHSLLLSRALRVASERLRRWIGQDPTPPPNAGEWRANAAVSTILEGVLAVDNALSRVFSRFEPGLAGLTIWAVASRSGD